MNTTIKVTKEVKETLQEMKIGAKESYNDVLERMIEDTQELTEETKQEITAAKKRIRSGKYTTQEEVEKMFL